MSGKIRFTKKQILERLNEIKAIASVARDVALDYDDAMDCYVAFDHDEMRERIDTIDGWLEDLISLVHWSINDQPMA